MQATTSVAGSADLRARVAQLPDDAVIDAVEFAQAVNCSTRHLDRLIARGAAPKPISALGRQVRRWRLGDVRAWLRGDARGT